MASENCDVVARAESAAVVGMPMENGCDGRGCRDDGFRDNG